MAHTKFGFSQTTELNETGYVSHTYIEMYTFLDGKLHVKAVFVCYT